MLKVGIIGVGNISNAHIPVWEAMENAELVALCDIRSEQMEKYPDKRRYTDFDEMLKNETLDVVDICLPTYLHTEYSLKALKCGIHVLCEKPVSLKAGDAEKLYHTAEKHHVKFMIAHLLRFSREYEILKNIYDSNKYGKLLSGSMERLSQCPGWSWDDWMKDEARSGLVPYDLHIHDLDFLVYAFGAPQSETCFRAKRPEQDYLHIVYDFGNFFVAADSSWYTASFPFTASFRFQFEKAVVAYKDSKMMIYECDDHAIDLSEEGNPEAVDIDVPRGDGYANEIHYFADCVLNDKPADKVKATELEAVINILNNL